MSKPFKKKIIEDKDKDKEEITFKQLSDYLDKQTTKISHNLLFELKFFLISFTTLVSTNIYIHKTYLNHYNFKLILLITLYFARRVLMHLWYHFNLRQYLISAINSVLLTVFLSQIGINVLYIFWDLIINYSIYSLLPLFYLSLLQIPIFLFDGNTHYESPSKEMIRIIKKVCYLSVEMCYYGIFIPVFFSVKHSPFFNAFAIFIYTIFALLNAGIFLFSFNYYKKAAEFHYYILSVGHWRKISKGDIQAERLSKVKQWSNVTQYDKDAIVEYKGKYYIGVEDRNFLEPNNIYVNWLYILFLKPKRIFFLILGIQSVVTLTQLLFYIFTQFNVFSFNLSVTAWYTFYSIYTMLQRIKVIFNK